MEKSVTEGQQDIRVSVVGSQVHRMKKKMIFYLDSLLPWKVPGYPLQDNKFQYPYNLVARKCPPVPNIKPNFHY